ncbi:Phosphotransferase enzyme family protein [Mesorhizobium albiziae]|uniref:Phosphotransferase enzyme family protein n=1 Tax=Neomesorhizobium albiziae TaxID=335020 RepID=A0A1I4FB88_9HYPH|nr:phosphotransferase [Mesorhizobium albiziae]GLS33071.1 hypothetical protein GCM10007937_47820 [Mesorhizobium albiziae]SFL14570.1 Phosphotransferase enzyme family protein [Mesorhizobium albiziae]
MDRVRSQVLWFGKVPPDLMLREIAARRMTCSPADADDTFSDAVGARAVVLNFATGLETDLLALGEKHIARFVDQGLRVDIVAPDDKAMGKVQTILAKFASLPGVFFHTGPTSPMVAEAIARHDAGPTPRPGLAIVVEDGRERLRKAEEILFQRAFGHCSEIKLVELSGGRSSARVFAVHMVVDGSNAGVWPQPAFANLDRNAKIAREYEKYREFADGFIPFGLRPNISDVVAGSDYSLLVGNFVDRSESLRDLAERDVASAAVTCLLDETLGGWRDQAYAIAPQRGSVSEIMHAAELWDAGKIQSEYVDRAQEHRVMETPEKLRAALAQLDQQYRIAPVHGDLHGENVRVRGNNSILIDLASVCRAPITADLAALETWFAFELATKDDPLIYYDANWRALVNHLYAPDAFRHPPGPCRPTAPRAWMSNIARQIRTKGLAIQSCPDEYQTAVAVQLLRRCQWNDGPPGDRGRRAHGYRLAAALVADLDGGTK